MTRAISLISFKLSQFMMVTKFFENSEWFGLPAHPWVIRAPASNPWGKRPLCSGLYPEIGGTCDTSFQKLQTPQRITAKVPRKLI